MDKHKRIATRSNRLTESRGHSRPATRALAENQLRDIAYVLHLTRRVREEILAEREANAHEICHA